MLAYATLRTVHGAKIRGTRERLELLSSQVVEALSEPAGAPALAALTALPEEAKT